MMKRRWGSIYRLSAVFLLACGASQKPCPEVGQAEPPTAAQERPAVSEETARPAPTLEQWRDGDAKRRIVEFVEATTKPNGPHFVSPGDRVAVFDNDGTLWSEQPIYFQFAFALDYVASQLSASPAPSWASRPWATQLKKGLTKDGKKALPQLDEKALFEIISASETQTAEDYRTSVHAWLERARHPRLERPYTELVFQPMVALLEYLRAHDYKTFIVTGGSAWFVRAFAEKLYGIPPEQVVGTLSEAHYELKDGRGILSGSGKLAFLDDGAGKPVGIDRVIGRMPIFAAGNSDGDREMLEYVTTQKGPSTFALLVHHDDPDREWAYDRASKIGKLDKALDQATTSNWLVVSMKRDFESIYAPGVAAPAPPAHAAAPSTGP
ncbi:MAG TPA: HAD family hydrolase [Polyangiaceae bacterium]|nr:HAD family hydrolase [Polyangiaceae bacterium]